MSIWIYAATERWCSHVGTILVTVEQCVQDGLQSGPSVTSKPSVWSRVTKKGSILAIIILINNNNNCYYCILVFFTFQCEIGVFYTTLHISCLFFLNFCYYNVYLCIMYISNLLLGRSTTSSSVRFLETWQEDQATSSPLPSPSKSRWLTKKAF